MTEPRLQTLYNQIGADTIDRLVQTFYPKVYANPVISPLFEGDMEEIMEKQRMFLTQFLGGPPLYSQVYGPPAMRRRHLPFEITPIRAENWLLCMKEAFDEVGLSDHPAGEFFFQRLTQVAAIMVNSEGTEHSQE
ncbi:group 2 truncated hemoglobin YjbI [Bacillus sp. J14TS2]|uniref:globin domain-containing protein n=1 Tax=Bacillus sp. J14TS2 TaxID=2807188 RepID=UPI001B15D91A|nr:globin [Bacillus sp. J14TS2]GIN70769.1 group 2 truncated hemoglobin YjbI [Bacillus sp. J14TS2]